MENNGGRFRKKKLNFSMVSNSIIRDETISLRAKGLYTLIQSYITMENFTLYKSYLMSKCCEGKKAFDSAWKELKDAGYLKQTRMQDEETKQFYWEYELLDEAEPPITEEGSFSEPYPQKGYYGSGMVWQTDTMAQGCDGKEGYNNNIINNNTINNNTNPIISINDVMDQISYHTFPVEDQKQVRELCELITEVLNMPDAATIRVAKRDIPASQIKERFHELKMTHIQYVLTCLKDNMHKISNIKSYLLSTLYNSTTTISVYYQNMVNIAQREMV